MASLLRKIDERRLDTTKWPTVSEEILVGEERASFVRRRNAILEYLATRNAEQACQIGGFSRFELVRLIKRCTADHFDGRLVGFRGCRPQFRVKRYERYAKTSGGPGTLSALFRNHPDIEQKMEDFALRRGNRLSLPSRIGLTDLRNKLLQLCREAGFTSAMYPLNVSEGGIRALSAWRRRFLDTHGRAFLKDQFGEEAARNFDAGWDAAAAAIDPHNIWVFDEYTVDTFVTVGIPQRDGTMKWVPMARFKVISGRRRGSRDVIVCKAVLKTEPNTTDFLEAVEAVVKPHQRLEFTVPGFAYPKQPCFAAELSGCDWALPSLVMLDNSKVHLSEANRRAIAERLACTVQFGIVRRPQARGDVESWHSYLAREFRKLASTTGTGPWDTRRVNPEKAAVELRLEVDHINQLLELLAAKFNSRPLNSLKGKTPVEAFAQWVRDENTVLRRVPTEKRESFALAEKHIRVRIACDVASGRMPMVRFQYADYVGSRLAAMRSRAGEECVLVLNPSEAHVAKLYAMDGTELDTLRARGMWHEPHTLDARINFVAKRKRGEVMDPTEFESPTDVLRQALVSGAKKNKRDALDLARLEQASSQEPVVEPEPPPAPTLTPVVPVTKPRVRMQPKMKSAGDW